MYKATGAVIIHFGCWVSVRVLDVLVVCVIQVVSLDDLVGPSGLELYDGFWKRKVK